MTNLPVSVDRLPLHVQNQLYNDLHDLRTLRAGNKIKNAFNSPFIKIDRFLNPPEIKYHSPLDTSVEKFKTKIIKRIESWDEKLELIVPDHWIQNKLDLVGTKVAETFQGFDKFNNWLNQTGEGDWYKRLSLFLAKLPLRSVRNILVALAGLIKGIFYTVTHPLKAANCVAKHLVELAAQLTKPEVWVKIGVGMIGCSLGQAVVMGNPVSVLSAGIGVAMIAVGLSGGIIKDLLQEEVSKIGAIHYRVSTELKNLPESLLTGFFMGLLIGGIQFKIREHEHAIWRENLQDSYKQIADDYVNSHQLPQYDKITLEGDQIVIHYNSGKELINTQIGSELGLQPPAWNEAVKGVEIKLGYNNSTGISHHILYDTGDRMGDYEWTVVKEIPSVSLDPNLIPPVAPNKHLFDQLNLGGAVLARPR